MKCHNCQEEKLSKEFPRRKITENCDHAPLHCLMCIVKSVEKSGRCSQCQELVDKNSIQYQQCLAKLSVLFPPLEESPDPAPPSAQDGPSYISVSLLSGDSTNINFSPALTIKGIKEKVQKELGPQPDKQRLLYNNVELKSWTGSRLATLGDYQVPPHASLFVVVLLYAIPDTFDHVVFDLFWGYPSTGRDYLDASVLLYNGVQFIEVVDFGHEKGIIAPAVVHSGDVMDDVNSRGHHTIKVHLKQIPPQINKLFFTLSAWSSPNISRYPSPSLRFFQHSEPEKQLCSDSMSHAAYSKAIIMCSLCRVDGQWRVFSLKELSDGNAMDYSPIQEKIRGLIGKGVV